MKTLEYLAEIKQLTTYGGTVFNAKILKKVFGRRNEKLMVWYHNVILKYLSNLLKDSISEIKMENTAGISGNISEDCPIWIYWNTGIINAPELVQCCIKSIQRNAGKHEIILLSEDSIAEYVEVPQKLYCWLDEKKISFAFIADYIRVSLLKKYGGIWMDATIFMTRELSDSIYGHEWYTLVNRDLFSANTVAYLRWALYFMCCGTNNIVMNCAYKLLTDYVNKANGIVDYFMLDYILALVYDNNEDARKQMDAVENNKMLCNNFLLDHLTEEFDYDNWEEAKAKRYIYKLSYKGIEFNSLEENSYYRKVVYDSVSNELTL